MKRLFLLGVLAAAGIGNAGAQNRKMVFTPAPKGAEVVAEGNVSSRTAPVAPHFNPVQRSASFGTKIGQTYYDLQSNYSVANRLIRHSDGTLSATWTESCTTDPSPCANSGCAYVNRGAGYNYFDGTTWIHGADGTCDEPGSAYGVFSARVGWPEMLSLPGGGEMIIAHTPLTKVSRAQKGTGGMSAWSQNQTFTPTTTFSNTWPRAIAVGNTIHMIATCQPCTTATGVIGAFTYYRSPDAGQTWDIVDMMLPGMDTLSFGAIGADGYALHANGNTVAISAGFGGNDWAMWKSTDNGTSWTKTLIRQFDATDTISIGSSDNAGYNTNDNYHAILVDDNGRVHVFAGHMLGAIDRATMEYVGYYPLSSEGILYWNDAMCPGAIETIVVEHEDIYPAGDPSDWLGDGSYVTPALSNPYAGGILSQPNAALAPNGDIYLVYSGLVEGTSNTGDSTGQSFRDLYVMRGQQQGNGAVGWSQPINIAESIANVGRTDFEEEVFASVAHTIGSDNMLHMIFQSDNEPGLHVRIDYDPEVLNEIVYYGFDVTTPSWTAGVTTTVCTGRNESAQFVNNMEIYPNPTTGVATVKINMKQSSSNVTVKVTNLLGQEVASIKPSALSAGTNLINIDLSAQPAGMYLYTVSSDKFSQTSRVVKQ